MSSRLFLAAALAVGTLAIGFIPVTAGATLIGDSVTATFSSGQGVVTQYSSPQTVGPGIEFSGVIDAPASFPNGLGTHVDVYDNGFNLTFYTLPGGPTGMQAGSGYIFRVDLGSLDWIGAGGTITAMTRTDAGVLDGVHSFGFGPNSAYVEMYRIFASPTQLTSFEFQGVPEPTTALLLATGLAGLAAVRWRRRSLH